VLQSSFQTSFANMSDARSLEKKTKNQTWLLFLHSENSAARSSICDNIS
jgi:hypothetical protein